MSWFQKVKHVDAASLTVTDAARQYVLSVLLRHNIPNDIAARLRIVAGDIAITMSPVQPGDAAISHQRRMILLLDAQTAQSLAGQTLDVRQAGGGPQLMLCSASSPFA